MWEGFHFVLSAGSNVGAIWHRNKTDHERQRCVLLWDGSGEKSTCTVSGICRTRKICVRNIMQHAGKGISSGTGQPDKRRAVCGNGWKWHAFLAERSGRGKWMPDRSGERCSCRCKGTGRGSLLCFILCYGNSGFYEKYKEWTGSALLPALPGTDPGKKFCAVKKNPKRVWAVILGTVYALYCTGERSGRDAAGAKRPGENQGVLSRGL